MQYAHHQHSDIGAAITLSGFGSDRIRR